MNPQHAKYDTVETDANKANRSRILRFVTDKQAVGRPAVSRQVLADELGMTLRIVDYHVSKLVNEGVFRRLMNGVVELREELELERPISVTAVGSNCVKVELGDKVIELSLREGRTMGMLLGGITLAFVR